MPSFLATLLGVRAPGAGPRRLVPALYLGLSGRPFAPANPGLHSTLACALETPPLPSPLPARHPDHAGHQRHSHAPLRSHPRLLACRARRLHRRYYSLFTLFMLVTFECTVVQQRLRNLGELRGMQTPKQHVHVYR